MLKSWSDEVTHKTVLPTPHLNGFTNVAGWQGHWIQLNKQCWNPPPVIQVMPQLTIEIIKSDRNHLPVNISVCSCFCEIVWTTCDQPYSGHYYRSLQACFFFLSSSFKTIITALITISSSAHLCHKNHFQCTRHFCKSFIRIKCQVIIIWGHLL